MVELTAEALSGTEITLDNEAATNPHVKQDAQKAGSGYGLLEWPTLLRSLDRIDPSYRDWQAERVGFVGAGRVGKGLSLALSRCGYEITCVAGRGEGQQDRRRFRARFPHGAGRFLQLSCSELSVL